MQEGQFRPLQIANGLLTMISGVVGLVAVSGVLLALEPVPMLVMLLAFIPLWLASTRNSRAFYRFFWKRTQLERRLSYLWHLMTGKDPAKELRAFDLGPYLLGEHRRLYDERLGEAPHPRPQAHPDLAAREPRLAGVPRRRDDLPAPVRPPLARAGRDRGLGRVPVRPASRGDRARRGLAVRERSLHRGLRLVRGHEAGGDRDTAHGRGAAAWFERIDVEAFRSRTRAATA